MTVSKRIFLIWWGGGLVVFAIALWLHAPLSTGLVKDGILAHQSAATAENVDLIQHSWRMEGLWNQAAIAMIADLIFIGIYGVGCVLAGLYYRANSQSALRILGWIVLVAGIIFLITDYGETIAQFIQLMRFAGDDRLAAIAASLQPIKIAAWIGTFLPIIAALIVELFSTSDA